MTGPTTEQEFNDALGAEIADALSPYAPDPEEFADGVQERVEQRQVAVDAPRSLPLFVRRAASFLPPLLLPLGLAKTGAAATNVASKGAALKFLPGVLALPAAIALMVWFGAHTVRERHADYAALEQEIDDIIAGVQPATLMVLNGWTDVEITDWDAIPVTFETYEIILTPDTNGSPEFTGAREVL